MPVQGEVGSGAAWAEQYYAEAIRTSFVMREQMNSHGAERPGRDRLIRIFLSICVEWIFCYFILTGLRKNTIIRGYVCTGCHR
jgi:hypothetical protein